MEIVTMPKATVADRIRNWVPHLKWSWTCAFVSCVSDAWYTLTVCLSDAPLARQRYTLAQRFLVPQNTIVLGTCDPRAWMPSVSPAKSR